MIEWSRFRFGNGNRPVRATADAHESLTFVVRLWREQDAAGRERWRGRVEHVPSREIGYVEDAAGLAEFIWRWTGPGQDAGRSGVRGG